MAKSHFILPQGAVDDSITVRLGAGSGAGNNVDDKEVGKLVKLVAESRYDLCAVGDPIQASITSVETATSAGFSIGGVLDKGIMWATADGLQGTPGAGAIAVGDFVVAGTATVKGTALTSYPKVCKATSQAVALFMWQVVSLGTGAGAVGTDIVIKRI